jgi:hypothetical protein
MAQTAVSLPKGSGSRQRLRTALNTIQENFTDLFTRVDEIEGGGSEWMLEGSVLDLDFSGERYFFETERDLDEIADGTPATVGSTGLDLRADTASRLFVSSDVLTLLNAELPTGFTVFFDHIDDLGDNAVPGEFFGLYTRVDPEETSGDPGDVPVELWWRSNNQRLNIDDWVNVYATSATTIAQGERNLSAVTLNVPQGGGNFKHSLCLNGDTVATTTDSIDLASDHLAGPILAATVGWIGSSDIPARGIGKRFAIFVPPLSDAEILALTTKPAGAPVNTVAPAISGTLEDGQTLTCSTGTWTGTGITFSYHWHDSGVGGYVVGENDNTYVAVGGSTVTCHVIATNDVWTTRQASNTVEIA